MQRQEGGLILEVGSGLSPMVTDSDRVVYSELSFPALRTLKRMPEKGFLVAADAVHLPFKSGSFSQVICSEVLEHLPRIDGPPRDGVSHETGGLSDPDLSPPALLFCP